MNGKVSLTHSILTFHNVIWSGLEFLHSQAIMHCDIKDLNEWASLQLTELSGSEVSNALFRCVSSQSLGTHQITEGGQHHGGGF